MFLTHHNLQGSQTLLCLIIQRLLFLTHHNLQGSQTHPTVETIPKSFLPIIIYKVLKRFWMKRLIIFGFLPIIIYKVLKPMSDELYKKICFLPIIIYKVLKLRLSFF